jgi:hypothetical protein
MRDVMVRMASLRFEGFGDRRTLRVRNYLKWCSLAGGSKLKAWMLGKVGLGTDLANKK